MRSSNVEWVGCICCVCYLCSTDCTTCSAVVAVAAVAADAVVVADAANTHIQRNTTNNRTKTSVEIQSLVTGLLLFATVSFVTAAIHDHSSIQLTHTHTTATEAAAELAAAQPQLQQQLRGLIAQ